ncbi:hypothetical protein [Streptomyces sp. UNOC14_S4]|uniref:hypothetical protein n=1 Tax=Streptomyces sp. UNOC14_S4 TaxID=2872340 RepID=UPI001E638EC4|nr:hypothetical protein [Streptomyces sp. UNOC14_S4]MCC3770490.1 hypothetical protein [Streptomyces sp. UNOC14_S4]
MALLAEYRVAAFPDRRFVEVYDADAYLTDSEAMEVATRDVVGSNGYHLYLCSLQPDIDVQVVIRVWDTAQEPPKDVEGFVPITLESETGILVVRQFTFGPAGETTLPRPGVYEGHVSWTGREATATYYAETLRHVSGWNVEQIGQAWAQNPVPEEYVLDLWWVAEPTPVDDEDEEEEL